MAESMADHEREERQRQLLKFVEHAYRCSWLQVQWHKGPCDCGLHELMRAMSIEEITLLEKINPELVASFRRDELPHVENAA